MTVILALVLAAAAPTAKIAGDAGVRLNNDDARLQFVLYRAPRGQYYETLNEPAMKPGSDNALPFRFVRHAKEVLGAGRAFVRAEKEGVRFQCDYTAHRELSCEAAGFLLRLRAGAFGGKTWKSDSANSVFPAQPVHTVMGEGTSKAFTFASPAGSWTLTFAKPVDFVILDTRRQQRDEFEVRFFCTRKVKLAVGKGDAVACAITSSAGKVTPGIRDFHGVWEGPSWVKLPAGDGIRPSSILDFTRGPTRRQPAGSDGRLFATTNGEFRFARRTKDGPQRFYGCRADYEYVFGDKQKVALYTKQLARYGYNSIRLRIVDSAYLKAGARGFQLDETKMPKFDQLVVSATRDGLYSFYDLLSPYAWKWGDFGLTAPGGKDPAPTLAGALFLYNDRTFAPWKGAVNALYGRKNKLGARTYPEDAAVPLVTTLSDCGLFSAWEELRQLPFFPADYGKWLAAQRARDPKFMEDEVCEVADVGIMPLHEKKAGALRRYLVELEQAGVDRQRDHLAAIKSKALVGAALGSRHYRDVAAQRGATGDFDCENFYLDPPRRMGERWTYPARFDNLNPLNRVSPLPETISWHERKDRPLCITSWNVGPTEWRAASGLLIGAWAAKHAWDGLWRDGSPDSPMDAAVERAVWALYARGDLSADAPPEAFTIEKGALTVRTERTVGGFSPKADGRIVAPPLAAELKGCRAAVWLSSLSLTPIATSKRMLLTHLTDMQNAGTLYADSRRDLQLRQGTGPLLVRNGSARIELALDKPFAYRVYALGPDGSRLGRIATETKDGLLVFTAEVRGAKGAQHLYEVMRE